jgi:L-lactate utilization protein LutB
MQYNAKANKVQIEGIIKNLEKRGMKGYYCENGREASEKLLSLIPDGALVSWGSSSTLDEIEVKDKLPMIDAKVLDPMAFKDPEEAYAARVKALSADVFLTGTNAITLEGELVNIDGTGNRVAGLCFGPRKVIVVVGANKIVRDEEAAMARIKTRACVANCIRLDKKTPCAVTGKCADCLIPGQTICSMTVVTRFCNKADRIHVILVNESLGF